MKKFIAFAMLLLSIPSLSHSQSAKQLHQIDRIFDDRTEVYFSFRLSDRSQISQLTKIISIDNVKNDVVYAYANKQEFTRFVALNIRYEVLTAPSRLSRQPMMETYDHQERTLNLTAYPTYPQYVAMMQQFATDYPDLCQLVNIGTTVNGRSLLVLKITDNVSVREYEPQFLYTSTMHGDETAGYIFMLNFIDWLLSGYGTDAEATQMVNSMELWINPLANPDGTYAGGDNTVNQAVRYNGNNVDLNRNYPDPQDGPHPDGNVYQPETMAFMAFADTMDFVMSANFHGGAEVFNYPWDTKITDHPDRDWWIAQGNEYVDTVHGNSGNNYMVDYFNGFDAPGVTNGFIWYEVNGGRQDYMNAYKHCREITIELSTTKLLPVADFSTYYSYNFESLKGWVNESLHGVNGLITDACDGHPIKAKVFVNNHDADSSHVFSSLPIGNYYRPIAPGNYSITYSAPGYQSVTLNNVSVVAEQGIVRDVQLQPLLPQAAFTAAPNAACGGNYQFTDLTGSALSWTWNFGDGSTSTEQNPLHEYTISGTYDVKLVVTNCLGTDSLIEPAFLNVSIIEQPIVDADTLFSCVPQSYTINASGDGDITWYDAATGGNVVATGTSFSTSLLSSPVTYYVSQQLTSDSAHVGLADNTIGTGAFYTAGTYRYLIFDAYQNFTLESVKVYANTVGNRTIELRDNNGVVLQSVTVMIPAGESRVTLNFAISAATGLQLGMAGANQMFRNQTGATYPYTLDGYLSITGNSANSAGAYYYYYDWKVIQSCTSSRVPVHIQIGNAQPITLEISTPTLNACEGSEVVFTAFSQNAFGPHYQWSVNGTAAGTDSPTFASSSLANGSVVSCVVSTTDNCSTNNPAQSNDVTIAVTPAPAAPQISLANNVDLTSTVGSVQWYLNNQAIDGATSTNYTALSNGSYYAVTTSNGCPSLPSNMIEVTALSISEISLGAMMNIFPNPTSDLAYVQIMSQEPYLLQVTNSIGQVLISRQEKSNTSAVDLSGFEPGIYWIRAMTSTETTQARILKK